MTIDFEDDLRRDLRASSTPDLGIDPDALIDQGHRAVTRRNLIRGGVGLGVLSAVGIGAGIITDRLPMTGQPAEGPSNPVARWVTVDFDRMTDTQGVTHATDAKTIRFEFNLAAPAGSPSGSGEPDMRFRFSDPDGNFDPGWIGSTIPTQGMMTWGTESETFPYVVGVVGGKAATIVFPAASAHTHQLKPVPGLDATAFVTRFDKARALDELDAALWADASGAVFNQYGQPVPTATFDKQPGRIFVDEKYWGYASGSVLSVVHTLTAEQPLPIVIDEGSSQVRAVLLPKAATKVGLLDGGAWTLSGPRPVGDRQAVLVTATSATTAATLTWTIDGASHEMKL